jgi:hypothetical protein
MEAVIKTLVAFEEVKEGDMVTWGTCDTAHVVLSVGEGVLYLDRMARPLNGDPYYSTCYSQLHRDYYSGDLATVEFWETEAEDAADGDQKEEPSPKQTASSGGSTDYYDLPEGAVTLNDLIEDKGMSFARGNCFKALYRLGNKQGVDHLYDLNKIIYFAERMKGMIADGKPV